MGGNKNTGNPMINMQTQHRKAIVRWKPLTFLLHINSTNNYDTVQAYF